MKNIVKVKNVYLDIGKLSNTNSLKININNQTP